MTKKFSSPERKQQILEIIAKLLQGSDFNKITTANIAEIAGVSEATLYRHFASKEQMFASLMEFSETTIFSLINKVNEVEKLSLVQIMQLMMVLLKFAENNPGIANLLINSKLISNSEVLATQTVKFFNRLETQFRHNLRHIHGSSDIDCPTVANLLIVFLIGKWQQFVYQDFKISPLKGWDEQWQHLQALVNR